MTGRFERGGQSILTGRLLSKVLRRPHGRQNYGTAMKSGVVLTGPSLSVLSVIVILA